MNPYSKTKIINSLIDGKENSVINDIARSKSLSSEDAQLFVRFVVLDVLDDAYLSEELYNKLSSDYSIDIDVLKEAPANSLIAVQTETQGEISNNKILYPFYSSHFSLSAKPGEQVWAFFESNKVSKFGYWLTRISESKSIEDLNQTHHDRKWDDRQTVKTSDAFEKNEKFVPSFSNGSVDQNGTRRVGTESVTGADDFYKKIIQNSISSKRHIKNNIPRYRKRPGDILIQSSNNSAIRIGSDRKSVLDTDSDGGGGSIDIVAGLFENSSIKNELGFNELDKDKLKKDSDPNFEKDKSRIVISELSKVDSDFNIQISGTTQITSDEPNIVAKSDHVRIVSRKSIKIILQEDQSTPPEQCASIAIENGNVIITPALTGVIKLGGDDANMAILCQPIAQNAGGNVVAGPVISTLGSTLGAGGANGQYSTKVLIK